jgi:hypothetical protein
MSVEIALVKPCSINKLSDYCVGLLCEFQIKKIYLCVCMKLPLSSTGRKWKFCFIYYKSVGGSLTHPSMHSSFH